jgi:hypothetical protein
VLDGTDSPSAYLNRLAGVANEWFDDRPATADDLAVRLGALRTGCTRLIVAGHAGLPMAEREWLVERCRAWAGKLDDAVHALEAGATVEGVRDDVDATVRGLIAALRDRARSAA